MIKLNLNTIAKRYFLGNLLAAALFLSLHASAARIEKNAYSYIDTHSDSSKVNKFEVKYLGITSGNFDFDVRYNNIKGSNFFFVIKDENGEVLFEKDYSNKLFHKKVELAKVDDINKLTFSIITDKDVTIFSKDVVIKTKYVEDVLVKIN